MLEVRGFRVEVRFSGEEVAGPRPSELRDFPVSKFEFHVL